MCTHSLKEYFTNFKICKLFNEVNRIHSKHVFLKVLFWVLGLEVLIIVNNTE